MQATEIELKPCPFCGGQAELVTGYQEHILFYDTKYVYVRCKNCKAETDSVNLSAYYSAKDKAIENWNRRENND